MWLLHKLLVLVQVHELEIELLVVGKTVCCLQAEECENTIILDDGIARFVMLVASGTTLRWIFNTGPAAISLARLGFGEYTQPASLVDRTLVFGDNVLKRMRGAGSDKGEDRKHVNREEAICRRLEHSQYGLNLTINPKSTVVN